MNLNHMATAYTSAGFGSLSLVVWSVVGRCLYTFTHAVPACGSRTLKLKFTASRELKSYLLDFRRDFQPLFLYVSVTRRFGFAADVYIGHTWVSISVHSALLTAIAHCLINSSAEVHEAFCKIPPFDRGHLA